MSHEPSAGRYVVPLDQVNLTMVAEVGGKNASLGEMIRTLGAEGIRVPPGFALTAAAFRAHLAHNHLEAAVYGPLAALDIGDVEKLAEAAQGVRERIRSHPLPPEIAHVVERAYAELSARCGEADTDVAVRSSATAEDLPGASFAGQQETYLNVRGPDALLRAVLDCMASLFTDRAIVYRVHNGFEHRAVALSVGVQKMVRSDLGSAGVAFTLDTESGSREVVLINAAFGLGETVVKGRIDPDEFWVHKETLRRGFRSIIRRQRGDKRVKLVYAEGGSRRVVEVPVPASEQLRFALSDDEVLALGRWALRIEEHYGRPMDIEWARDGRTGELFVVQARPETVHAQRTAPALRVYRLGERARVLARGRAVGSSIGAGAARVVRTKHELAAFRPGEVLVAEMTDPDWEPVLRRAAAIATDRGGRACHAAIVARELGLPCVVGAGTVTRSVRDGQNVTVSCAEGDEGRVYEGLLRFEREEIDPAKLPAPRVPVQLNVGNPEIAFAAAQLPSAGVGLARIEFIVSSWVGIHPMALAHPERVSDPDARAQIRRLTAGYASPSELLVDRLASGTAQIAAAFHPRPVLVRFSDFKTNEYAGLIGGRDFEPVEANPMLGFRGASRYYDARYRDGFALECAALRRVRQEMGLANVRLMIPFCRTLGEARKVLAELERNGLRRGQDGLEVWVMCEIPNNVLLAEEFSELFDGFSIGSNDLTQLTLGIDRDSELLAPLFDERDPGVQRFIRMVIEAAHRRGRPVGFCGQAPSDHPEFAAFLVEAGIDSISVTPDSLAEVVRCVATSPGP
jgi:pyruvate,water dikinase